MLHKKEKNKEKTLTKIYGVSESCRMTRPKNATIEPQITAGVTIVRKSEINWIGKDELRWWTKTDYAEKWQKKKRKRKLIEKN